MRLSSLSTDDHHGGGPDSLPAGQPDAGRRPSTVATACRWSGGTVIPPDPLEDAGGRHWRSRRGLGDRTAGSQAAFRPAGSDRAAQVGASPASMPRLFRMAS